MSVPQGKWKEEQILIICVGTHTTLAQLGCHELTPPVHRFPTRMFQNPDGPGWRPYHTFKRKKTGSDEDEWVEDKDSEEGAVYPMHTGRIVNMEAFLAFLDHVHTSLTSTFHNTPIVLIGSPHWSRSCKETITRFIFEKTKTPALCLMHSALATQYGLKWPTMTVVDIGYQKVDVSCIYDGSIVSEKSLGVIYPQNAGDVLAGGELFTRNLHNLLKDKGFTYEMANQLKKSPVAEVLPFVNNPPEYRELPKERGDPPIAGLAAPGAVADGALSSATSAVPANTATSAAAGDADDDVKELATEDGVLDVATIVTSGQTKEFLARKEKEKEKSKTKRGKETSEAAKPKLPNSKRTHNIFHYEEILIEEAPPKPSSDADPSASAKSESKPDGDKAEATSTASPVAAPDLSELPMALDLPEGPIARKVQRDIEVGPERLMFITHADIERIADTVYRTVQSIPATHMRAPCWDHLVIVGNGARVRGLRDNILAVLTARYLISPSSASIFTGGEMPSVAGTPSGSGPASGAATAIGTPVQTPGAGTPAQPAAQVVNPLLQAATAGAAGAQSQHPHHMLHGQTPMSIKLAPLPTYLSEWAKHGFEEAVFLGAQVAARMAFCLHNVDAASLESLRSMSLSRVDYNELGPKAIRRFSVYR
ncbi:SWI/SNF and RSC complexes subunit arp9 [Ceratocystis platani]|uniref:SWI/SNF and RSC complexes subunit arp9 n=1 Tax=Ceratocystis fimbriata f. sp. platani TaxID=88771 RepID=A0A0F8DLG8_CERFI|nr:SWI/SNF and RSC complexes subunit arp9 [Ceratocystis platani]